MSTRKSLGTIQAHSGSSRKVFDMSKIFPDRPRMLLTRNYPGKHRHYPVIVRKYLGNIRVRIIPIFITNQCDEFPMCLRFKYELSRRLSGCISIINIKIRFIPNDTGIFLCILRTLFVYFTGCVLVV